MDNVYFYHGTSTTIPINQYILPADLTSFKRESFREKFSDKVFLTNSLKSAKMYAKKACLKYGGTPIVYQVKPIGEMFNTVNAEYVAEKAVVISKNAIT